MSELTRQVEALNKAHLSAKPVFVGRASLFFTSSDAARHDFQEVYEACMGAVRTLAQYDSRFEGYDEDILHPNSISAQRELKTKEENKEIDKRIKSLLKLLALYATEKSSHLILEYLLQRYRINELNMEALLTNMISIHDTKIFAKLVMLIPQQDLKSSNWAFLGEVSRSGVPLDRAQLVKRLVVANNRGGMGNSSTKGVDTTLLQALCSHVQTALKTAGKSGMPSESRAVQGADRILSFFTATLLELLAPPSNNSNSTASADTHGAVALADDQLRVLWPVLLDSLRAVKIAHTVDSNQNNDDDDNLEVSEEMSGSGKKHLAKQFRRAGCMLVGALVRGPTGPTLAAPILKSLLSELLHSYQVVSTQYAFLQTHQRGGAYDERSLVALQSDGVELAMTVAVLAQACARQGRAAQFDSKTLVSLFHGRAELLQLCGAEPYLEEASNSNNNNDSSTFSGGSGSYDNSNSKSSGRRGSVLPTMSEEEQHAALIEAEEDEIGVRSGAFPPFFSTIQAIHAQFTQANANNHDNNNNNNNTNSGDSGKKEDTGMEELFHAIATSLMKRLLLQAYNPYNLPDSSSDQNTLSNSSSITPITENLEVTGLSAKKTARILLALISSRMLPSRSVNMVLELMLVGASSNTSNTSNTTNANGTGSTSKGKGKKNKKSYFVADTEEGDSSEGEQYVFEVLRALSQRHPSAFGSTTDHVLRVVCSENDANKKKTNTNTIVSVDSDDSGDMSDSSSENENNDNKNNNNNKEIALRAFLGRCFNSPENGMHSAPLDQGTSLLLSLRHPSHAVRFSALEAFEQVVVIRAEDGDPLLGTSSELDAEDSDDENVRDAKMTSKALGAAARAAAAASGNPYSFSRGNGDNNNTTTTDNVHINRRLGNCGRGGAIGTDLLEIVDAAASLLSDTDPSVAQKAWTKGIVSRVADYTDPRNLARTFTKALEYWRSHYSISPSTSSSTIVAILECLSVEEVAKAVCSSGYIVDLVDDEDEDNLDTGSGSVRIRITDWLYSTMCELALLQSRSAQGQGQGQGGTYIDYLDIVRSTAIDCACVLGAYVPLLSSLHNTGKAHIRKEVIIAAKNDAISCYLNVLCTHITSSLLSNTSKTPNSSEKNNGNKGNKGKKGDCLRAITKAALAIDALKLMSVAAERAICSLDQLDITTITTMALVQARVCSGVIVRLGEAAVAEAAAAKVGKRLAAPLSVDQVEEGSALSALYAISPSVCPLFLAIGDCDIIGNCDEVAHMLKGLLKSVAIAPAIFSVSMSMSNYRSSGTNTNTSTSTSNKINKNSIIDNDDLFGLLAYENTVHVTHAYDDDDTENNDSSASTSTSAYTDEEDREDSSIEGEGGPYSGPYSPESSNRTPNRNSLNSLNSASLLGNNLLLSILSAEKPEIAALLGDILGTFYPTTGLQQLCRVCISPYTSSETRSGALAAISAGITLGYSNQGMPSHVLVTLQFLATTAVCNPQSSLVRRSGLLLAQSLMQLCDSGLEVIEGDIAVGTSNAINKSLSRAIEDADADISEVIRKAGKLSVNDSLSTISISSNSNSNRNSNNALYVPVSPISNGVCAPSTEATSALLRVVLGVGEAAEADGLAALDLLSVRIFGAIPALFEDMSMSMSSSKKGNKGRPRSSSVVHSENMLSAAHQLLHVASILSTAQSGTNYALSAIIVKACSAAPLSVSWEYVRFITATLSESGTVHPYDTQLLRGPLMSACVACLRLSTGTADMRAQVIQWCANTLRIQSTCPAAARLQSELLNVLSNGWLEGGVLVGEGFGKVGEPGEGLSPEHVEGLLKRLLSSLLAQHLRTPGREDVRAALQSVGVRLSTKALCSVLKAAESTFTDAFVREMTATAASTGSSTGGDRDRDRDRGSGSEDMLDGDGDVDIEVSSSGLAKPVADLVAVTEALIVCLAVLPTNKTNTNNANNANTNKAIIVNTLLGEDENMRILALRGMLASAFRTFRQVLNGRLKAVLSADYCKSVLLDLLQGCAEMGGSDMLLGTTPSASPADTNNISRSKSKSPGRAKKGTSQEQNENDAMDMYYQPLSVYNDLDLVLSCIGSGKSAQTKSSALKLLQTMLAMKLPQHTTIKNGGASAAAHCIKTLGRYLADATVGAGLAATISSITNNTNNKNGKIKINENRHNNTAVVLRDAAGGGKSKPEDTTLSSILTTLVGLSGHSSASPQQVLQPLCAHFYKVPAQRRAQLVGLALNAFSKSSTSYYSNSDTNVNANKANNANAQPALPAAVTVLLSHCVLAFEQEKGGKGRKQGIQQAADAAGSANGPQFVLLSRAAQTKASRIARASVPEDIYRLAQEVTLQQAADVQIEGLVEIVRAARKFIGVFEEEDIGDDDDEGGGVDNVDVIELHSYRARISLLLEAESESRSPIRGKKRKGGLESISETTTGTGTSKVQCHTGAGVENEVSESPAKSRGAAASMVLLLLEYLYDLVESRAFHRSFVTFVDKEDKAISTSINGSSNGLGLSSGGVQGNMQMLLLSLFDNILQLIATAANGDEDKDKADVSIITEGTETKISTTAFSNIVEHWCLDILKSLQRLLDPASFVSILHELVGHNMSSVRKVALAILSARLERFTNSGIGSNPNPHVSVVAAHAEEKLLLLEMSGQLQATIIEVLGFDTSDTRTDTNTDKVTDVNVIKVLDPNTLMETSDRESSIELAQSALMCLDVLARGLGSEAAWRKSLMRALQLSVQLSVCVKNAVQRKQALLQAVLEQQGQEQGDGMMSASAGTTTGTGTPKSNKKKNKKTSAAISNGNGIFTADQFIWNLDCSCELKLLASLNLCSGTLVRAGAIGARALPHLSSLLGGVLGSLELTLIAPQKQIQNQHMRMRARVLSSSDLEEEEIEDENENENELSAKVTSLVRAHTLLLRSSVISLTGVYSAVPTFCHPYVQRTLSACLGLCASEGSNNKSSWAAFDVSSSSTGCTNAKGSYVTQQEWAALGEDVDNCLSTVASNVPPRLAVPSLLACTPELLELGSACATRTCTFLKSTYSSLDRQSILEHLDGISEVSAFILDYRRAYGSTTAVRVLSKWLESEYSYDNDDDNTNYTGGADTQTTHTISSIMSSELIITGESGETRVENSAVEALVTLCLKLTEPELRAFLAKFAEWRDSQAVVTSTASVEIEGYNGNGIGIGSEPLIVHRGHYARVTSYYNLMTSLGGTLQAIFPPSLAPHWAHCADVLSTLGGKKVKKALKALSDNYNKKNTDTDTDNDDSGSGSGKKRKKRQSTVGTGTRSAEEEEISLSSVVATLEARELLHASQAVLSAVYNCCVYDHNGVVDEERYALMMPAAAGALTSSRPLFSCCFDINGSSSSSKRGSAAADKAYLAFCNDHTTPCIVALAQCAAKDTLWKPLCHKVLMATRDKLSVVRLSALQCLHKLFTDIGEEFLLLLPECLPFLSELMEDSDEEVVDMVNITIQYIEELSGEKLDEYLK